MLGNTRVDERISFRKLLICHQYQFVSSHVVSQSCSLDPDRPDCKRGRISLKLLFIIEVYYQKIEFRSWVMNSHQDHCEIFQQMKFVDQKKLR